MFLKKRFLTYISIFLAFLIFTITKYSVAQNNLNMANITFPFFDDFEEGLDNWIVGGDDWAIIDSDYRSNSHCVTESPNGDYIINEDAAITLAYPIDLRNTTSPVLTFFHKIDVAATYVIGYSFIDIGFIEVSIDGGTNWSILKKYQEMTISTWKHEQIDLSDYKVSQFKIRFRLKDCNDGAIADGWCLDDIEIMEKDTSTLSFPFSDSFENGLENWITSGHDWTLDTNDYHSPNHCVTESPNGPYLHYEDAAITLAHSIDISNTNSPKLTFFHKIDVAATYVIGYSFIDIGFIEVSIDGGTNWSILKKYQEMTISTWKHEQIDLSDYKVSQFKIRFRLKDCNDGAMADGWCLDDIRIEGTTTLLKGDVNFDGVVNEIDIQMIVDIILLIYTPTPDEFWAADCNDDGDINSADIQCALEKFLANAHIIVISPNGGELWPVDVPQTIVWDPSIVASKVRIDISIDAGNNWITVTDSTENDSSYSWTPISDFVSENCRIKITSINSDSIYDQSDEDFTISSLDGQTHFKYKTTDESYSIVIDAATLDSISLAPGDEIGVFTPAGLCVGASVWTGTVPLDLAAWRDDPQTPDSIDGYQIGEIMYFRVWDYSSGTTDDYDATPTYSVGNGTFGYSFYSRISLLEAFTSITQTIALNQSWNWISFNVVPSDLNVETIFSQTTHLEILVNGAGKFYIPGVINGIGDLNILEGYKLFVSEDDTVTVTGQRVQFGTPIPLSLGWNFIAYLPQVLIPIEIALGSIVSKLEIAKQDDGKFYVPNVINSIGDMAPSEGYKLYVNEACTLVYSVTNLEMSINDKMPFVFSADTTAHFRFKDNTGESYSIVIDEATINGQIIEIDDEIGVFTSDSLCVGASVFTGSFPIGLIAWKDDSQTSEVDGYITGDTMSFRIWDTSEDIEHGAIASYMSDDSTFESSFYSHISLLQAVTTSVSISTVDVPSEYFLSQNYPNPFNLETNITYALPNDQNVVVKIYNIQGQLITILEEGFKKAGIHKVNWNASKESSGIYICSFQAGRYSKILKLLLLK